MTVINLIWLVVNLGLLWAAVASFSGVSANQPSYLGLVFMLLLVNSIILLGNIFG